MEYVLLIMAIALIVSIAMSVFAGSLSDTFGFISNSVADGEGVPGGGAGDPGTGDPGTGDPGNSGYSGYSGNSGNSGNQGKGKGK